MVKTVRVSEKEYLLLKKTRNALIRLGTDRLPLNLRPSEPKVFTLGRTAGLCAEALSYILGNEKEVSK